MSIAEKLYNDDQNKPSKSIAFNVNKYETIVTIHNFSDISCIERTISTFLHCAMTFLKVSVDPTRVLTIDLSGTNFVTGEKQIIKGKV